MDMTLAPEAEIAVLEADPESWWLAYRNALAFQERVEREHGTATERILRRLPKPVAPVKPVVKPPRWRHG